MKRPSVVPCTRYRPPGTIKRYELVTFLIVLVVRGRSIGSVSLGFRLLNAPQRSIHLRGAIAACSSSKSLISGMGKLGRKRVLLRQTRWRASIQTTRRRVISAKALQVFACSTKRSNVELWLMTYLTQRQYIIWMKKCANCDLYIQWNIRESRHHRS
jgi:hypothetical protein